MKKNLSQLISYSTIKVAAFAFLIFTNVPQLTFAQVQCDPHFSFRVDSATHVVTFNGAPNPSGAVYKWNFGDGMNGQGNPIDHKYMNPGDYKVCLTVIIYAPGTNTVQCQQTWCDTVRIHGVQPPACSAKFTHSAGNTLYSVLFHSSPNNTANIKYNWNFGDGTGSNQMNPYHVYPGPGNYYACLTVQVLNNSGVVTCTDTWCDSIRIGSPPPPPHCDPHFAFTVDSVTMTVKFNGAPNPPNTTYHWNFGDGTSGVGNPATHQYRNPGTYNACLTVTIWTSNNTIACKQTWCTTIRIPGNPPPPPNCNAQFRYQVDTVRGVVQFYGPFNPQGTSYSWTFGDGTMARGNPVEHKYFHSGTYLVCLKVIVHGMNGTILCKDEWCDSVKVTVTSPPPPPNCHVKFDFKIDSISNTVYFTSSPLPAGSTYFWNFGDGNTSTDANPVHVYAAAGTYDVCLTVTIPTNSGTHCTTKYCNKVIVGARPPVACSSNFRFYFDWNHPRTVKFQSSPNPPGTVFNWDFDDGNTSSLSNPTHVFQDTGLYNICLTVTAPSIGGVSCTDTWCRKIYINGPVVRPPDDLTIALYPNPATTSISLSLTNVGNSAMIQFFDFRGEVVLSKEQMGNGVYNLDTHAIQPGLYYYRVVEGSKVLSSGKLIIQ